MKLMQELLAKPVQVTESKDDDFDTNLEKWMDQESAHNFEGRRGLTNFAKLCQALGYVDKQHFGQLAANASIGDIVNFLEDNSGAFEAMIDWIKEFAADEWNENLLNHLESGDEPEESDE
jgi:hypothetical protein